MLGQLSVLYSISSVTFDGFNTFTNACGRVDEIWIQNNFFFYVQRIDKFLVKIKTILPTSSKYWKNSLITIHYWYNMRLKLLRETKWLYTSL